ETPDRDLVKRHEKEIFPLLRKRYLFAEVHDFLLYDLYSPEGYVNEDVFAYSNRAGEERALVVFHNKYANAHGWIRMSAAYPVKTGVGDERTMEQKSLGEGLGLHADSGYFTIFRDHASGLEYIRSSLELIEKGLYLELDAYKYHVFIDFREVMDNEWHQYAHLENYLNGRGVPSVEEALKEIFLQSIHTPFRELVNAGQIRWLIRNRHGSPEFSDEGMKEALDEVERKAQILGDEIMEFINGTGDPTLTASRIRKDITTMLMLPDVASQYPRPGSRKYKTALNYLSYGPGSSKASPLNDGNPEVWAPLLAWGITRHLGALV
ncbi:MAG: alpha-amylase family glycosyl hydrolase, partial [Anaerolineales bacterium]